jgi:hypothetical protein
MFLEMYRKYISSGVRALQPTSTTMPLRDIFQLKKDGVADEMLKSTSPSTPLVKQVGGSHYKKYPIQPIEFAHANKLDYFQGAVVDYVIRFRDKGGRQDLEKAIHILELLIDLEYNSGEGKASSEQSGET